MLTTIVVYISLYLCSLVFVHKAQYVAINKSTNLDAHINFYIGILIYSLIIGLRWNVGVDYPAYYDLLTENINLGRIELIPRLSIEYVQEHNIPFYMWFIMMAFIQMFFLQKTFNKELKPFVVWGVFFYLTTQLALAMNIIRQASALTIILYAYSYLAKKEYKWYLLWVFIASLFHTSALIGIPIIFLSKIRISINQQVQICIVLFFFVFGEQTIDYIINILSSFSNRFSYLIKLQSISDDAFSLEKGSGLGVIFYYLRYIVLILYSKQLFKKYGKYGFDIFYTISFVGICFYKATMYNMILSRVMMYFTICSIVCFAMLMVYLLKKSKTQINLLLLLGLTIIEVLMTSYTILKGDPWTFIWNSSIFNI